MLREARARRSIGWAWGRAGGGKGVAHRKTRGPEGAARPRSRSVLELRAADGRVLGAVVFTVDDAESRRRAVARRRAEAAALGYVVPAAVPGARPRARRVG